AAAVSPTGLGRGPPSRGRGRDASRRPGQHARCATPPVPAREERSRAPPHAALGAVPPRRPLVRREPRADAAEPGGRARGGAPRLDAAAAGVAATLRPPAAGPAAVRWLERRGRKTPNVSLAAVPLDLAPILKENLFDRIESVVLTSATLAAGGDFGYLE